MSAILLAVTGLDPNAWEQRFRVLAPNRDIRPWPQRLGDPADVFATEPLPTASPLWTHPKMTITPHNAAASGPRALVANMLRQFDRFEAGLPLENVIDHAAGY